jgi:hypothetical protein
MKRTITMWAVITAYGCKRPMLATFDWLRRYSKRDFLSVMGKEYDWKHYYRQGFRCRKVKISWEE